MTVAIGGFAGCSRSGTGGATEQDTTDTATATPTSTSTETATATPTLTATPTPIGPTVETVVAVPDDRVPEDMAFDADGNLYFGTTAWRSALSPS